MAGAASDGAAPGQLYVDVVRPALAGLQDRQRRVRTGASTGIETALLADLVPSRPHRARPGTGRAAVLSCRSGGIEAVDGSVAADFLASDGWAVSPLDGDDGEDGRGSAFGSGRTEAGPCELAVAVTAGPEDVLRLAPACTALRRLADPPVIVLCDFSGRSRHSSAGTALGADAVAHDPEDLLRCAARGLPESGRRRWGVRLIRTPGVLRIAPTGQLDAENATRLAAVVASRLGTFSRLIVDLRDLAEIDPAGLGELASWPQLLPLDDVELLLAAGDELELGDRIVRSGWQAAPASLL